MCFLGLKVSKWSFKWKSQCFQFLFFFAFRFVQQFLFLKTIQTGNHIFTKLEKSETTQPFIAWHTFAIQTINWRKHKLNVRLRLIEIPPESNDEMSLIHRILPVVLDKVHCIYLKLEPEYQLVTWEETTKPHLHRQVVDFRDSPLVDQETERSWSSSYCF